MVFAVQTPVGVQGAFEVADSAGQGALVLEEHGGTVQQEPGGGSVSSGRCVVGQGVDVR